MIPRLSRLRSPASGLLLAALLLAPCALLPAATPPVTISAERRITLTASADGTPPFTYQWHRNAVALLGETRAELVITDPKATGLYHCVIANSAGSTTTPPVRLANTTQADAGDITITRKQPK